MNHTTRLTTGEGMTVFGSYRKVYKSSEVARFFRGVAECRRWEDHSRMRHESSVRRWRYTSLVLMFTVGRKVRRTGIATTPKTPLSLTVSDRTGLLRSSDPGRTITRYSNGLSAAAITRSEQARRVSVNSPHAPILSGKARETINYFQSTKQTHETLH